MKRRYIKKDASEVLSSAKPHPDNVRVCPDCGAPTEVKDSRMSDEYGWISIRRNRACTKCRTRFWTLEIQDDAYRRYVRAAKLTRETLRKAIEDMEVL